MEESSADKQSMMTIQRQGSNLRGSRWMLTADTHHHIDAEVYVKPGEKPTKKVRPTLVQVLATFAVSLYSTSVGFASAFTGPALASMARNTSSVHPTSQEESWIGSLMPLSALVGGLMGGVLIEFLGRKITIMLTALPSSAAFMMIAFANNIPIIMASRSITGFCVGVTSLALPVYLGETLPPEVRGMLGLVPTTLGNTGILVCYLAGFFLEWNNLAFIGVAIPIPAFILMFFLPESPTWYINRGQQDKAIASLKWLRGRDASVTAEITDMTRRSLMHIDQQTVSIKDLVQKRYLWPLSISLGLMFFQQFSGINAMIFYTVTIFEEAGSSISSNMSAIVVGIVNLAVSIVAAFLIDRLGRKILLYISSSLMCTTLTVLGWFFFHKDVIQASTAAISWLPLTCFVVYIVGFSIGAGPIPWLMMGEILPAKVRGIAASIATSFNWACTFIVTKTFIDMKDALGLHGAFWFFGGVCACFLVFTIFCVIETQGKSLVDIERKFKGEKVQVRDAARLPSMVNMKLYPTNM